MLAILLVPYNGGQYHLGEAGLDDTSDILHADTLFSALTNIYAMAFSGADRFVNMVDEGKLRFSSCFYALLAPDKPVFFLPKPPVQYAGACDMKLLKKIRYLSTGAWNVMVKGFDSTSLRTEFDPLGIPSLGSDFVYLENELPGMARLLEKKFFRSITTVPKVKVHTTEQEDRLYHETCIQFSSISCGGCILKGAFYFFIEHDLNEEEWTEFLGALRILADEGVGGQRTSGKGQFEKVEIIDVDLPAGKNAIWRVGLSPVSPADDREFHDALHYYDLFVRGGGSLGMMGNSEVHRRQARFVKEGALFRREMKGRLVDVSPSRDRSVLRYGINFSIPLGA